MFCLLSQMVWLLLKTLDCWNTLRGGVCERSNRVSVGLWITGYDLKHCLGWATLPVWLVFPPAEKIIFVSPFSRKLLENSSAAFCCVHLSNTEVSYNRLQVCECFKGALCGVILLPWETAGSSLGEFIVEQLLLYGSFFSSDSSQEKTLMDILFLCVTCLPTRLENDLLQQYRLQTCTSRHTHTCTHGLCLLWLYTVKEILDPLLNLYKETNGL